MCELFGFSSQKKQNITGYLKEFYSHSVHHPHGWGLVTFEGNTASIEKQPMQASKSLRLQARLAESVEAAAAFGHIRYATIGQIEYDNCHPYTRWTQPAGAGRWCTTEPFFLIRRWMLLSGFSGAIPTVSACCYIW